MRYQGKLIEWNDEKGYGFVLPADGGRKAFVHIKSFVNRPRRPLVNDILLYDLTTDTRGRLQAANVYYDMKDVRINNYLVKNTLLLFLAIFFLLFIAGSAYFGKLHIMLTMYYFILSFLTYFAYDLDKSAAEDAEWRLPESLLHSLSILGGWPGALLAQVSLRHKTKKQSFRNVFWACVTLNCLLLLFLLTKNGSIILNNIP